MQSKGLSRVFSNTIVQKHQFFGAQPSCGPALTPIHDCWRTTALTVRTSVTGVLRDSAVWLLLGPHAVLGGRLCQPWGPRLALLTACWVTWGQNLAPLGLYPHFSCRGGTASELLGGCLGAALGDTAGFLGPLLGPGAGCSLGPHPSATLRPQSVAFTHSLQLLWSRWP